MSVVPVVGAQRTCEEGVSKLLRQKNKQNDIFDTEICQDFTCLRVQLTLGHKTTLAEVPPLLGLSGAPLRCAQVLTRR